jgi:hypothetical protein
VFYSESSVPRYSAARRRSRFGDLTYVRLANAFIINVDGGPTDRQAAVILEAPSNPDGHFIEVGRTTDPATDRTAWLP